MPNEEYYYGEHRFIISLLPYWQCCNSDMDRYRSSVRNSLKSTSVNGLSKVIPCNINTILAQNLKVRVIVRNIHLGVKLTHCEQMFCFVLSMELLSFLLSNTFVYLKKKKVSFPLCGPHIRMELFCTWEIV